MNLQLVDPGDPRTIQFIRVHDPGRSDRVHGPVQSHFGPAVADYHGGPALRIAPATAEIESSGARCHTVEVYRIGQKAGADLNLTQRDIIGEGPVSNLFVGLGTTDTVFLGTVDLNGGFAFSMGNDPGSLFIEGVYRPIESQTD